MTMGERGYLASMKLLFEKARNDATLATILVLDDDAVGICDLRKRLMAVLAQPRCGGILAPRYRCIFILTIGHTCHGHFKAVQRHGVRWILMPRAHDARRRRRGRGRRRKQIGLRSQPWQQLPLCRGRMIWLNLVTRKCVP